mmetsp:Transcript_110785/g.320149  ORF Transcript_110785/g.320149 Transcript_110785/m.320149 type:complete len:468 (+) Transcript_110785:245-1648(+)
MWYTGPATPTPGGSGPSASWSTSSSSSPSVVPTPAAVSSKVAPVAAHTKLSASRCGDGNRSRTFFPASSGPWLRRRARALASVKSGHASRKASSASPFRSRRRWLDSSEPGFSKKVGAKMFIPALIAHIILTVLRSSCVTRCVTCGDHVSTTVTSAKPLVCLGVCAPPPSRTTMRDGAACRFNREDRACAIGAFDRRAPFAASDGLEARASNGRFTRRGVVSAATCAVGTGDIDRGDIGTWRESSSFGSGSTSAGASRNARGIGPKEELPDASWACRKISHATGLAAGLVTGPATASNSCACAEAAGDTCGGGSWSRDWPNDVGGGCNTFCGVICICGVGGDGVGGNCPTGLPDKAGAGAEDAAAAVCTSLHSCDSSFCDAAARSDDGLATTQRHAQRVSCAAASRNCAAVELEVPASRSTVPAHGPHWDASACSAGSGNASAPSDSASVSVGVSSSLCAALAALPG